jgi:hypothetical protein
MMSSCSGCSTFARQPEIKTNVFDNIIFVAVKPTVKAT